VSIQAFSYLEFTKCVLEPAGVGYSYNDGPTIDNSFIAGEDMWALLQLFYKRFGQYSNELHVAGESYGGTYIPHIANAIHKNNKALSENSRARDNLLHVNLTSILIGNGELFYVFIDALLDPSRRLD
jgi:cathepsin A (carboxypeptidase C)